MQFFSEFYGPERQKELLQEADKRRLVREALAGNRDQASHQTWPVRQLAKWASGLAFLRRRRIHFQRLLSVAPIDDLTGQAGNEPVKSACKN